MSVVQQNLTVVRSKAVLWSVGVHVLLLLLFFWLQYTVPAVVQETGGGLEVNLGSSNDGSGTDQPMAPGDPANFSASVALPDQPQKDDLPKDMLTTDDASATPVNNKDLKKHDNPAALDHNPVEPKPKPKYVYNGNGSGNGGNGASQTSAGGSEGNTTGPGDRGVPGGTPGAANYSGIPGSGGIGHTLSGRQISPDKFEAEFREGGKVVIHVTVDRQGNIVDKYVKSSSNQQLTKLALEKLSHAKFSQSTSAEPQQFGEVTIIFKSRN